MPQLVHVFGCRIDAVIDIVRPSYLTLSRLITRETPKVFDLNQTALLPLPPALDGGAFYASETNNTLHLCRDFDLTASSDPQTLCRAVYSVLTPCPARNGGCDDLFGGLHRLLWAR